MKEKIHPKYYPNAQVTCACGNSWTTGSTRESLRTDMCSACHPFFTGEQRIVDTEGQVERFYKKLEARDQFTAAVAAREAARGSTDQPLEVLQLGERAEAILAKAGVTTVDQALEKLAAGDEAMLSLEGFGRKSLIDLKKRLRARGFLTEETPGEVEAAAS
jgi:large subunit ribosomal protein L31